MPAPSTAHALREIDEHGYVVLPDLLSSHELERIRTALAPRLGAPILGRNNFEGYATQRVYSLVAVSPELERLVEHPLVLALCDALLEPNYLLTASQAICIHPGESEQPFHTDDTFYRIPRPRAAVSVSTIVAVDAFTPENGGTQVVPGSHRWDDAQVGEFLARLPREFEAAPRGTGVPVPAAPLPPALAGQVETVVLPPGAVVFFLGTLLHRGGANVSASPRLALSNQYCAPWARPQENFFLSIPPERARAMSPRVRELIGYSIHPPFMGHALGMHPSRALGRTKD